MKCLEPTGGRFPSHQSWVNIVTGMMPGWKGKDIKQLGGNVLIDPEGKIVLNHVSANPHDRPSSQEISALTEE